MQDMIENFDMLVKKGSSPASLHTGLGILESVAEVVAAQYTVFGTDYSVERRRKSYDVNVYTAFARLTGAVKTIHKCRSMCRLTATPLPLVKGVYNEIGQSPPRRYFILRCRYLCRRKSYKLLRR